MASSSIPRCAPVARRPAEQRRLEPSAARKIEPVSRRSFRPARNRRDDEVEYSLAPPRPIEGLERTAQTAASTRFFGRARIRLWTILNLVAPARGYGVRRPKTQARRAARGALPEDALHIVEVLVADETDEVTLLPVDADGRRRNGRGGDDRADEEDASDPMDDEEDTHVMDLEVAPFYAAPARDHVRGAISFG